MVRYEHTKNDETIHVVYINYVVLEHVVVSVYKTCS